MLAINFPASTSIASLREWDLGTGRETRAMNLPAAIQAQRKLAFSPDGNVLAGQGFTGEIGRASCRERV